MNIKKIFTFSLVSLLLISCFKDEGNYEYGEVNQLKINFEKLKFNMSFNEELKIVPNVVYFDEKNENIPDVSYIWLINSEIVSRDKEYVYKSGNDVKKEHIQLVVEEVRTKEKYNSKVEVIINSPLETGLIILSENRDNGNAELSMIPTLIELGGGGKNDTLIYRNEQPNIYEHSNGQTLGKNPVSIREHYAFNPYDYVFGEVTVITENGKRIEELNGLSLKKETSLYQEFTGEKTPLNFATSEIVHTCWDSYVIDANTNLMYSRRNADATAYHTGYFDMNFAYNDPVKYENIFFTFYTYSTILLALEVDNEGKRNLVGIKSDNSNPNNNGIRLEPQVPEGLNPEFKKHFGDIKGDIIASDYMKKDLDSGCAKHCFIIKEGSKYILHYISIKNAGTKNTYFNILNSKRIGLSETGILGMVTNKSANQIYFWNKSSVYVVSTDFETPVKEMYTVSGRELVSVAEQTNINYLSDTKIDPQLIFAFSDGSIEVHELLRPNFNTLADEPVFKSKENYGKIKQIIYKLGDSFTYHN